MSLWNHFYISTHFCLIPFPTIPFESICQIQCKSTEMWSSWRYFGPSCVEVIGSWLKGETVFVFHWVKNSTGGLDPPERGRHYEMYIKGGSSIRIHPRDSSCKGSLNKKAYLFSNKFHHSADAIVQTRSLCEISNSASTEMGVVCCDLALPVLWADRGSPRAKVRQWY